MTTQYWLVKQEPEDYSWENFVRDGRTLWTGVRNYAARNNLRAMAVGDAVLFYHSGESKSIVGLARVSLPAGPDPTADSPDEGWVAVELEPVKPLRHVLSLATLKADDLLKEMIFVRQSRLSVSPVSAKEFARLKKLGGL